MEEFGDWETKIDSYSFNFNVTHEDEELAPKCSALPSSKICHLFGFEV